MAGEDNNKNFKNSQQEKPVDIDQPGVDSVKEDISKFKDTLQKFTKEVQEKTEPVAKKVQEKIVEKTPEKLKATIKKGPNFGFIKYLFIPLFIIFVVVIIISLVRNVKQNGGHDGEPVPTSTEEPTPSLELIDNVRESVYANDSEILELQKELDVINNEMFSVPLRDSTINPPALDFNINFKK